MKRETKNVFLIISIAFNIAFIGMFLYNLIFVPKFPSPEHPRDFRGIRNFRRRFPRDREFHNKMRNMIMKRRREREEFMDMLLDERVSKEKLTQKLNKVITLENRISKLTGEYMIKCRLKRKQKK